MSETIDGIDEDALATRSLIRTAADIHALIAEAKANPTLWYVYSRHANMDGAVRRASALRLGKRGHTVMLYLDNLRIVAVKDREGRATVCLRWLPPVPSP